MYLQTEVQFSDPVLSGSILFETVAAVNDKINKITHTLAIDAE